MGRGVGVGLLEAARRRDARDRAAGGVQVRGAAEAVGDTVAEPGRGLRVAEDDRPGRLLLAEQLPHPAPEGEPVAVDDGRGLRDVLAQHVGHQQMRPLGVAPQGQPQQVRQRAVVAHELDTEPLGDPTAGPDPVVHCVVHRPLVVR